MGKTEGTGSEPKNMRVLVTGSSGLVGSHVVGRLRSEHDVRGVSRGESEYTDYRVDLRDQAAVAQMLKGHHPEVIVHCAAKTNIDYAHQHRQEVRGHVVEATRNIASRGKEHPAVKLIFVSSDYVYEGKKEEQPYTEDSPVRPVNYFGELKVEAENMVRELSNYCILRPGVIYAYQPGGRNFLMQLLELTAERPVPIDQVSNPTDAAVFAELVARVIARDVQGTYNATGPESMDRYTFAKMIAEIFRLDASLYKPKTTVEMKQLAVRPLYCGLDISKLLAAIDYQPPSVRESLEAHRNLMGPT